MNNLTDVIVQFVAGQREGKGTATYANGSVYTGDFKAGHGKKDKGMKGKKGKAKELETEPEPAAEAEAGAGAEAEVQPKPTGKGKRRKSAEAEPPAPEEEATGARAWFKKNWAFVVAGALLVGVVTGFVIRATREDPQPDPVIVFRPGG